MSTDTQDATEQEVEDVIPAEIDDAAIAMESERGEVCGTWAAVGIGIALGVAAAQNGSDAGWRQIADTDAVADDDEYAASVDELLDA